MKRLIAGTLLLLTAGCTDLPTEPADAVSMSVRGMTLAEWSADGYATPAAFAAIDDIAATGSNTITFVVTAYQSNVAASAIRVDPARTPTPISVQDAILKVQSVPGAIRVALKPHVDLDDGTWRGHIEPADPSRWFSSYASFIMTWANVAESMDADQLVVGTELAGTIRYENRWRGLIADVRSVFSGEIIYAASWDEAGKVPFWDAVDVVGINFYAPVSRRRETHRFDILKNWQPWIDRMRRLHKLADRDILLTEVGYRSIDGAGLHPYDFTVQAPVDLQEQADLYWAALQALGDKSWVRGVYWWNWRIASAPSESTDYTPRGKPAEGELIGAWR